MSSYVWPSVHPCSAPAAVRTWRRPVREDGTHEAHHHRIRIRERVGGAASAGAPRRPLAARRPDRPRRLRGRAHPRRGLRRPRLRARGPGGQRRPAPPAGPGGLRRRHAAGRGRPDTPGGRLRRRSGLGGGPRLVAAALGGAPRRPRTGRRSRRLGRAADHRRSRSPRRGRLPAPSRARSASWTRTAPRRWPAPACCWTRGPASATGARSSRSTGSAATSRARCPPRPRRTSARTAASCPPTRSPTGSRRWAPTGDTEVGVYCGSGRLGRPRGAGAGARRASRPPCTPVPGRSGPRTSPAPWPRARTPADAHGAPDARQTGPVRGRVRALLMRERTVPARTLSPASCGVCRRRSRPSSAPPPGGPGRTPSASAWRSVVPVSRSRWPATARGISTSA